MQNKQQPRPPVTPARPSGMPQPNPTSPPYDICTLDRVMTKRAYLQERYRQTLLLLELLVKRQPNQVTLPTGIIGFFRNIYLPPNADFVNVYEQFLNKLESSPRYRPFYAMQAKIVEDNLKNEDLKFQKNLNSFVVAVKNALYKKPESPEQIESSYPHLMQRTFGPALAAMNLSETTLFSPPPARPKAPCVNSRAHNFEREIALLNPRYRITVSESPSTVFRKHRPSYTGEVATIKPPFTAIVEIVDNKLPSFPHAFLHVPFSYPKSGARLTLDGDFWNGTDLFRQILQVYKANTLYLSVQSIATLLDLWYNSINQVINNTATAN